MNENVKIFNVINNRNTVKCVAASTKIRVTKRPGNN